MGFIASFVIALAFAVVGELLRPKQTPPNAKPAALDDFDIPTAEEGRKIPIIAGKVKITGANVTWWGDLEIAAIKRKVKTGWFSSATQVINNKYFIGMQMVLCHGRTEGITLHKVLFGDDEPTNTKTAEPNGVTRVVFDDNDFFGGDETEGGVSGTCRFYSGTTTQTANAYWEAQIGETAPAYRRLVYAMMEHVYMGTSHYLKPIGFEVSSYPNGLSVPSSHHIIGEDCNPICFIYEVLTDRVWGACVNVSDIDTASFLAAAETIYEEGLGMSMIYNGASTARDIIAEILRHLDGCMYSDPETGLITIKLARADYDADTIPVFTAKDFQGGIKFSRPSWSETKNSISAGWTNRENGYTVSPVAQKNLANIQVRGGIVANEDMDFTGFCTEEACMLAVARALRVKSFPLANLEGALQRRAGWSLKPASVFKVVWPELGINGVIFRAVSVKYGTINNPAVTINCVEDIFSVGDVAYDVMPPSGWVDPIGAPTALHRQKLFELPVQFTGVNNGAYVATLGSRSSGIDLGYRIYSGLASGDGNLSYKRDVDDFTPSAVTTTAFPDTTDDRDATGFSVTDVRHASEIPASVTEDELLAGDSVILIVSSAGEELCAAKNFTGTSVTDVIRGIYGTQKLNHPSGAIVWFLSRGFGVENATPYDTFPQTVYAKLLPYNAKGSLSMASASQISVTLSGKALKPNPPHSLAANGDETPVEFGIAQAPIVFTWQWEDVVERGGRISETGPVDSMVPNGGSFTLRLYRDAVLERTVTGLTSKTWTYTEADQTADGVGAIEVEIEYVAASAVASEPSTIGFNLIVAVPLHELMLDAGPGIFLPLSETSGLVMGNSVGDDGTYVAPILNQPPLYSSGLPSVAFNASGGSRGYLPASAMPTGYTSMTIVLVYKPDYFTGIHHIVARDSDGGERVFQFRVNNSNIEFIKIKTSVQTISGAHAMTADEPHLVLFQVNGSTGAAQIEINGEVRATGTLSVVDYGGGTREISLASRASGAELSPCGMSVVGIYNRLLTPEEKAAFLLSSGL